MGSRDSLWVSLISIAGGAILVWLGYGSLDAGISGSLFEAARDPTGNWQLFTTILGIALLIAGITGLLRGR